jgi:hypothetical protein
MDSELTIAKSSLLVRKFLFQLLVFLEWEVKYSKTLLRHFLKFQENLTY